MIHDSSKVTSFGCGCNKKTAQVPGAGGASVRRATIYQVLDNGSVVSEFDTLGEARVAATQVGGRVKVTSKLVA
jgi:hypothetical protein